MCGFSSPMSGNVAPEFAVARREPLSSTTMIPPSPVTRSPSTASAFGNRATIAADSRRSRKDNA